MKFMTCFVFVLLLSTGYESIGQGARSSQRLRYLASRFPNAFAVYTRGRFLIPISEPTWSTGRTNETRIEINGILSEEGIRRNVGAATISAEINNLYGLNEKWPEIQVGLVKIDGAFPANYAWRVLLAEILLKYPEAKAISIDEEQDQTTRSVRESLSQGMNAKEAILATPLAIAAKDFGFRVASHKSWFVKSYATPDLQGEMGVEINLKASRSAQEQGIKTKDDREVRAQRAVEAAEGAGESVRVEDAVRRGEKAK
jgi:hypothetical protein